MHLLTVSPKVNIIPLMKFQQINTVANVVELFGGTASMADWAGVTPPAVSNWIARGYIAPGWHFEMEREAQKRGYTICTTVFGDAPEYVPRRRKGRVPRLGDPPSRRGAA